MAEQHTPGPLIMVVHCDVPPNNCLVRIDCKDGTLATVQTWRSGVQGSCEETKANARLFIAAPETKRQRDELLEALVLIANARINREEKQRVARVALAKVKRG